MDREQVKEHINIAIDKLQAVGRELITNAMLYNNHNKVSSIQFFFVKLKEGHQEYLRLLSGVSTTPETIQAKFDKDVRFLIEELNKL